MEAIERTEIKSIETIAEPDAEEDLERKAETLASPSSIRDGDPASTLTEKEVNEMLVMSEKMMAAELSIKKIKKIDNESKLNKFIR